VDVFGAWRFLRSKHKKNECQIALVTSERWLFLFWRLATDTPRVLQSLVVSTALTHTPSYTLPERLLKH
jgi:hypothetical protein